jgi:cellulose synthase/poly-beta-1,6-N-acetylglucosamine synthase-like glycosyltransferase
MNMQTISIMLWFTGAILVVAVTWFCVQVLCACLPRRRSAIPGRDLKTPDHAARVAVLIPAHNESVHLIPTLQSIEAQKLANCRVLVVADNCTDDTARIARLHGVEVIERTNPRLRGKGYALDFGVAHLAGDPPEVVIVLDADCLLAPGALQQLLRRAHTHKRPVQALYLMKNPGGPGVKAKIAEFAWRVKNHARPRGLHRMGLPCQLTGSGMAFPWPVLAGVPLATGEIVEDMKLGVMLAERGHPPVFCEEAVVFSYFPSSAEAVSSQRTRWEHGHLSMILREGLPMAGRGLIGGNAGLFFLAADLCIPPLALLVMLSAFWGLLAVAYSAWSGDPGPALVAATFFGILAASVLAAWRIFGRDVLSGRELMMAPVYMVSKISLYAGFLVRRQVDWVRSKRDNETK